MSRLFGTDGVRGVANEELTPQLAYKLGLYSGQLFKMRNDKGVLIGRDTRLSGQMLKYALGAGFMAAGLDVIDLGIISTPAVAYLVKEHQYSGGAVISASHNPFEYNGIKLFDEMGFKLTDEEEDEIERMIKEDREVILETGENLGTTKDGKKLVRDYEEYLIELGKDLRGLKIALDCGNGAVSEMAPRIFKEMGIEVTSINTQPNGKNINDDCGSTNPQLVSELVLETGADLGFSFDGDADRIIAVDEKGNFIDGDHMLAIFAKSLKGKNQLKNDTVVGTVMTNMGLDVYLESIGANVIKAPVGDRYVLEEMLKSGYNIGGEQSGHVIFLDYNTTGDGLITAIQLLYIMKKTGKSLSELANIMQVLPQVLVNAKVKNEHKHDYMEDLEIKNEIKKLEAKFGTEGRVLIRPSGTEPLVRVMIEGRNQEELEKHATELAQSIEQRLG